MGNRDALSREASPKTKVNRNCPYCREDNFDVLYKGSSIPTDSILSTADFDLVSCRKCKTIYVNPAPTPETLISYYPPRYYSAEGEAYPRIFAGLAKVYNFFPRVVRELTAEPIRVKTGATKRVLEIGCADGQNLEPFMRAGWHAYAIEPNAKLADIAKTRGIDVHVGRCDTFQWRTEAFDAIILKHVLEHDYDPRSILERSVDALKFEGLIYVEIPVVQSPSWRIMGRYWGELEFPIHLSFLRREQILDVIVHLGCRPVTCMTRTLLGGPFRSLEKLSPLKHRRESQKAAVLPIGAALQVGLIALNAITRQGEAFSVVARRELAVSKDR